MTDKLQAMLEHYTNLKQEKNTLETRIELVEAAIVQECGQEMARQLDKDYGTGTMSLLVGKYKAKITVSKKVTWEQEKLADLAKQYTDFVDVKYNVQENKYKAFPSDVQKAFEAARTVEPSKPRVVVEV